MAISSLRPASAAGHGGRGRGAGPAAGRPAIAGLSRGPVRADRLLPLADVAALTAAGVVASIAAGRPGWPAAGYAALVLLVLSWSGLQRLRLCMRVSDQGGRILAAVAAPGVVLLPWTPAVTALRLVIWTAGLVLAFRLVAMSALRAARRRGHLAEAALLVGAGPAGLQLAGLLADHPELGLRPRGFVDSAPEAGSRGWPVLGAPASLSGTVAEHGIRRVIVCWPEDRDEELTRVLHDCAALRADVCVAERRPELAAAVPRAGRDAILGIRLVPLGRGRRAGRLVVKRSFDVAAATILLGVAAPLLGMLALVIRRRHSAFFRQDRLVGCGRRAEIIKLRTMGVHPDSDTRWVVPTEQLTPLGRWLRATHLDELPQLINVIRGDMSLVGPRPERPYFAGRFGREIPRYDDRHRMRAGLTGLAQVHGRHGDTSIHERVRFDNFYIDNWSLWLDIVILARTLTTVPARGTIRRNEP